MRARGLVGRWLAWLKKRGKPGAQTPLPTLATQLGNPYRPIYGKERRLEDLAKPPPKG